MTLAPFPPGADCHICCQGQRCTAPQAVGAWHLRAQPDLVLAVAALDETTFAQQKAIGIDQISFAGFTQAVTNRAIQQTGGVSYQDLQIRTGRLPRFAQRQHQQDTDTCLHRRVRPEQERLFATDGQRRQLRRITRRSDKWARLPHCFRVRGDPNATTGGIQQPKVLIGAGISQLRQMPLHFTRRHRDKIGAPDPQVVQMLRQPNRRDLMAQRVNVEAKLGQAVFPCFPLELIEYPDGAARQGEQQDQHCGKQPGHQPLLVVVSAG